MAGSVCELSVKPLDFSRLSATLLLICPLGHEGVVKKKAHEQPTDPWTPHLLQQIGSLIRIQIWLSLIWLRVSTSCNSLHIWFCLVLFCQGSHKVFCPEMLDVCKCKYSHTPCVYWRVSRVLTEPISCSTFCLSAAALCSSRSSVVFGGKHGFSHAQWLLLVSFVSRWIITAINKDLVKLRKYEDVPFFPVRDRLQVQGSRFTVLSYPYPHMHVRAGGSVTALSDGTCDLVFKVLKIPGLW